MTNASDFDADELQRLREENEALRSQIESRAERTGRGRAWLAIALVVVGSLLLPVAVATTWIRTQVLSTDDYVETVAPLAKDPAIQESVAAAIADYVRDEFDLQQTVSDALPDQAQSLSPIIAAGAVQVVRTVALEVVKSQVFADLWADANRIGHSVAIEVLTGRDEGVVRTDSGQIYIPIGEMVTTVADQAGDQFGVDIVSQLPDDVSEARFVVAESDALADAQDLLEFLDRIAWLSVVLSLAFLVAAFFVAPSRSRGAVWVGVGVVTSMFVMRLVYAWGRNVYRDGVSDSGGDVEAATAFFDIVARFLRQGIRVVFVAGVVLLILGWLTGPGARANRARDWLNRVTGRASERIDEPGAATRWIAEQRSLLRTAVIALAVVTLFLWQRPTGLVVLFIALLAGVLVFVIEMFARAVAADDSEPAPAAETDDEVDDEAAVEVDDETVDATAGSSGG